MFISPKTIVCAVLCLFIWMLPTSQAEAQVSSVCPERYTYDTGQVIPYCSDGDLNTPDNNVTRLVISVHGIDRSGQLQLDVHSRIIDSLGLQDEVAIIAPQFLIESDVDAFNLGNDIVFWDSRWVIGSITGDTKANLSLNLSSYTALDALILDALQTYPNTTELVIIGHSAGGQLANRYAATNLMHTTVTNQSVDIRYIAVNPSSYLYFDEQRVIQGTVDQFDFLTQEQIDDCPAYNGYRYGLDGLNTYASQTGAEQIRNQYPQRRVIYLAGANDNDPNDPGLSTICQSMLQGSQRLERATIYYNYLQLVFGQGVTSTQSFFVVPNAGHSSRQMYSSDCGMQAVYDLNIGGVDCQSNTAVLDANNDGIISPSDAMYVINRAGTDDLLADIDLNGTVEQTDLDFVTTFLGTTP